MALVLLAALSASQAWAASPFVANLRKAESRKEPDERAEYYTRAIDAWGPSEDRMLLGQCRFGRGQARVELWQFAAAEPDLTQALEIDPGNKRAKLLRGRARFELGRYGEAAKDLADYIGAQPDDEEGYLELSQVQLKQARSGQAVTTCLQAEKLDEADGRAWLCEGRARMARRDWDDAAAAFTTALSKPKPPVADAYAGRAVCRVAQGRSADALKDYDGAVPAYEDGLKTLGDRKAPAPELKAYQQETARAYFGRGRLHEFLSQPEPALADYRRACALGHDEACARTQALAPAPKPEAAKPPKRKRWRAPSNDAGERIYGS